MSSGNDLRAVVAALVVAAAMSTNGCATMQVGGTQRIPVSTIPADASVECDGNSQPTPCVLTLSRAKDHVVILSRAGYLPRVEHVVRHPTGRIHGNWVFGGLIGIVIDLITGANNDLVPVSLTNVVLTADAPQVGEQREQVQ